MTESPLSVTNPLSAARERPLRRVLDWACSVPFKGVILVAVLLQIIGEQYPFSNFPMYTRLTPSTTYMYVTDGADHLLPMVPTFGIMSNEIKKMVRTEERSVKHKKGERPDTEKEMAGKAAAGAEILAYLLQHVRARHRPALLASGLRVYEVTVRQEHSRLVKTAQMLAEIPATGARVPP